MPSDLDRRQRRPPLVSVSGAVISYAHTILGYLAFFGALVIALGLHYKKVVKNGIAGWPDEWWPSVSATIGDWYPERNFFQVGIALMSGPRILLVLLSALLVSLSTPRSSRRASVLAVTGIARTFACGGWVYVTSTDDHDFHDVAMIAYLLLTPAWMYISGTSLSSTSVSAAASDQDALGKGTKLRKIAASAFFGMIPFMIFFFYRHKVLEIPGAYTSYAFFEWGLIVFDLGFDAASVYDLSRLEIQIVEASDDVKQSAGARNTLIGGTWVEGGAQGAIQAGAWSGALVLENKAGKIKLADPSAVPPSPSEKVVEAQVTGEAPSEGYRAYLSLTSDVYLNFVFWTNATGLAPTLFFFSVYNLSIGGEEGAVLSQAVFLGLVLFVYPLRRLFCDDAGNIGDISNKTLAALHAFSIPSLACWWWSSQHGRLLLVMLGAGTGALALAVEWGRAWERGQLHGKISVWLFSLLLTNVAKYANHSNHPLWVFINHTNGGWNTSGLIAAIFAIAELATRKKESSASAQKTQLRTQGKAFEGFFASLGLGALLYLIPMFISDSGTMIAWTWTGWPIKGPQALQHGYLIIAAFAAGIALGDHLPNLGRSPLTFAVGSGAFAALLLLDDWPAFVLGALPAALWISVTARPLIEPALRFNPIRILAGAWLIASLLVFFEVLTVAYAFVPVVGPMMREKTWLMLIVQQLFVASGLFLVRDHQGTSSASSLQKVEQRGLHRLTSAAIALVVAVAATVPSWRAVTISSPSHPEERLVTAGIHTVHFGHDQHMYESTRRLSSIYKEMDLDIVGLLETDLHRVVYGNRDLTQWLSQEMGMYADIGPSPKKHTWGAILLSRFPILNTTHHLLPSPHGELAPAIEAWLDIYGVETQVIVSHNGQEEDPLDRELQTKRLAELFAAAWPNPAIFLGYVVTKPHAERPSPYKILFEDGKIHDVDPTDDDRWCEYIGFRALERVGYVRVSRYTVSDTELQTVKLRIPPVGYRIDPDKDTRPHKMTNDTLPLSWQYPFHFYAPTAMVYNQHMYYPRYLPDYFATTPHAYYHEWSPKWQGLDAST